MVKFEPESQEETGGEKSREEEKSKGLVKQNLTPRPTLGSPWVRLE